MKNIPTQTENPKGLHQRFHVEKLNGETDPKAEYFVLRLDSNGKDPNHINACRIGIQAYANAIEPFIPELANDLRERYPARQQPVRKTLDECKDEVAELEFKEGLFPYVKSLQNKFELTDEVSGQFFYYLEMWEKKRYRENETWRIRGLSAKAVEPQEAEENERVRYALPSDMRMSPGALNELNNMCASIKPTKPTTKPTMKTLKECKDEIARKWDYADWRALQDDNITQIIDKYHDEAAELYCASKSEQGWVDVSIDTKFDGEYLCRVEILQECGVAWIRHRVIENKYNKWEVMDNETVTHWMPLPPKPTTNK